MKYKITFFSITIIGISIVVMGLSLMMASNALFGTNFIVLSGDSALFFIFVGVMMIFLNKFSEKEEEKK